MGIIIWMRIIICSFLLIACSLSVPPRSLKTTSVEYSCAKRRLLLKVSTPAKAEDIYLETLC